VKMKGVTRLVMMGIRNGTFDKFGEKKGSKDQASCPLDSLNAKNELNGFRRSQGRMCDLATSQHVTNLFFIRYEES
jgi:hypothetical protein